jgi:hypothetical protein
MRTITNAVISACLLAAFSTLAFAQATLAPTPMLQFLDASGGIALPYASCSLYSMWLRMQTAYDLAQARKHQGKMNIPRLIGRPSP